MLVNVDVNVRDTTVVKDVAMNNQDMEIPLHSYCHISFLLLKVLVVKQLPFAAKSQKG